MNTRARTNVLDDSTQLSEVLSSLARIEVQVQKIDPLYNMFSKLKTDIDENTKKLTDLHHENRVLKNRVMAIEQRERLDNLEISGLPTSPNETVKDICMKIAHIIDMKLDVNDILACHRVPTRVEGKPPNIIVHLRDRALRANFIRTYKLFTKKNHKLLANAIHPTLGNQPIYVNEHLCPAMKLLRAEVKRKALAKDFNFVWIDEGQIKVRKDKEKPLVIKTYDDLNKLDRVNRDAAAHQAGSNHGSA